MSPSVTIHLLNLFRLELNKQHVPYQGSTVGEVIKQFERDHLDQLPPYLKSRTQESLNDAILILLNGANVQNMKGMNTPVSDGDEIQLSVPIIGG